MLHVLLMNGRTLLVLRQETVDGLVRRDEAARRHRSQRAFGLGGARRALEDAAAELVHLDECSGSRIEALLGQVHHPLLLGLVGLEVLQLLGERRLEACVVSLREHLA